MRPDVPPNFADALIAPAAMSVFMKAWNSPQLTSCSGKPAVGSVSNTLVRTEASPVSLLCQNGELAESAKNWGM